MAAILDLNAVVCNLARVDRTNEQEGKEEGVILVWARMTRTHSLPLSQRETLLSPSQDSVFT